ncbi:hypothetical protein EKO27_g7660 [Xylaria grammica]|uniref:Uncharacterized protein n=1 Tax=Xylaria grammica TaxID=363999 RepID=A0A439CZ14_9PEZI|nr:hypothetical protein EKO27_g7660 [Xylaria grammica]
MASFTPSVGVELEFLLCVRKSDIPVRLNRGPRPSPDSTNSLGPQILDFMKDKITSTMRNATSLLPQLGDRVITSDEEAAEPDGLHLREYRDWTVRVARRYHLRPQPRDEHFVRSYQWYPFKIASPALWATENSWAEIRAVVQAVKDELDILIPPGAAMHFHYGHGKEYIPFKKLRRIAALLLAVDPLMAQLHPVYRRQDETALSNRLYSRVAHGRSAQAIARTLNAENIEEEPEVPVRRRRPVPYRREHRRRPNFICQYKRGDLKGYGFHSWIFSNSGYPEDNEELVGPGINDLGPVEIPPAVREILQSPNAPTVAELMRYGPLPDDRPAYSFQAYTAERYKQVVRATSQFRPAVQNKRTIEFRQMASTFNPMEVVAHGKVIIRLCEFAAEASLSELWNTILDCAVAEDYGNWYDVFDLLGELGLVAEARILQQSVARSRGETLPDNPEEDAEEEDSPLTRETSEPGQLVGRSEEGLSWWEERPEWYGGLFALACLWSPTALRDLLGGGIPILQPTIAILPSFYDSVQ